MKARTYFDPVTHPAEAKVQSCFLVANLVAAMWAFVSIAIKTLFRDSHNLTAEIFWIGSMLVAVGMYSLILPLWFVLKMNASK